MFTEYISSFSRSVSFRIAILAFMVILSGSGMHALSNKHILPVTFCCPVSNAPFSGTRVLDYEPFPGSTDSVPVHGEEVFYRDSVGRIRSEVHYGDQPTQITLLDFPAGVYYRWTAGDNIITRYKLPRPDQKPEPPEPVTLPADSPVVEGVQTRYSHFSEKRSGVQTNVQSWFAPSLKINLVTISEEPGVGKSTYRYQHVKLGEPEAALFHVPEKAIVSDVDAKPPDPPVPAKAAKTIVPVALPHAIEDDNYLEAVHRMQNALFQQYTHGAWHEHAELRLVDLDGKESNATLDVLVKDGIERVEETAAEWHYVYALVKGKRWTERTGTSPLRLYSISRIIPQRREAFDRIAQQVSGYIALQSREEEQQSLRCSGTISGAEICFDQKTGYPLSITLDGERILYPEWAEFNNKIYPSHFFVYRDSRLQMEGHVGITELDQIDPKLLEMPSDAEAVYSGSREDAHLVLFQGNVGGNLSGEALVRIHVDTSGRVTAQNYSTLTTESLVWPQLRQPEKLFICH